MLKDNLKAVRLDVRTGNPQPIQLFDLNKDPSESRDIAAEHPELVAEMAGYMDESHEPLDFMSLFKMDVSADTPF